MLKKGIKSFALLLLILLLCCGNLQTAFAVDKSEIVNNEICIVYDNSGSTYSDETWCRYKYAMEIFASFVDYENGSKLHIFPLCEVTVGGTKVPSGSCVTISNFEGVSTVRDMDTESPGGTPLNPLLDAYALLKSSTAKNKTVIILSDGVFSGLVGKDALQTKLKELSSQSGVTTHYFGSATAVKMESDEAAGLYCYVDDINATIQKATLIDNLTAICTKIFGQSALSLSQDDTDGMSFQLNKDADRLIVWASGTNVGTVTLKNDKGTPLLVTGGQAQQSVGLSSTKLNAPTDSSLAGSVTIYNDCPSGIYKVECANAGNITVFYQRYINVNVVPDSDKDESTDAEPSLKDGSFLGIPKWVWWLMAILAVLLASLTAFLSLKRNVDGESSKKAPVSDERPTVRTDDTDKAIGKDTVDSDFVAKKSYKAYNGDEKYIFVSYAHADSKYVIPIVERLMGEGYRVWYDDGIDPGTEWAANIARHIAGCSCFIAFVSNNYFVSDNCKEELHYARNRRKNRFLVYLEDFELQPEWEMRLGNIQNIHKYKYTSEEEFLNKLFSAHGLNDCKE